MESHVQDGYPRTRETARQILGPLMAVTALMIVLSVGISTSLNAILNVALSTAITAPERHQLLVNLLARSSTLWPWLVLPSVLAWMLYFAVEVILNQRRRSAWKALAFVPLPVLSAVLSLIGSISKLGLSPYLPGDLGDSGPFEELAWTQWASAWALCVGAALTAAIGVIQFKDRT